MPKHHHVEENEIFALIERPESFLSLLIKEDENKEWAINEIANGGPKHKQIYSSLLLKRIEAMVKAVEKQTGNKFTVQKGIHLTSHKEEAEVPVPLILTAVKKQDQASVAEALAKAPAHEIIAFNSLLQAIEWSITALNKTSL